MSRSLQKDAASCRWTETRATSSTRSTWVPVRILTLDTIGIKILLLKLFSFFPFFFRNAKRKHREPERLQGGHGAPQLPPAGQGRRLLARLLARLWARLLWLTQYSCVVLRLSGGMTNTAFLFFPLQEWRTDYFCKTLRFGRGTTFEERPV